MNGQFALLSIVYMIGFVYLFDCVHYKHKFGSWLRGETLMTQDELSQIQAIWSACQDA